MRSSWWTILDGLIIRSAGGLGQFRQLWLARARVLVAEACDQLGEPTGPVDVLALDVVVRDHRPDGAQILVSHRDAGKEAVESGLPGVGPDPVEVVGRPGVPRRRRDLGPQLRGYRNRHIG
jgi:hypothetical protein